MTTAYKILFMVELLNEYYSNLQCHDFTVVPSADTTVLMKNHQMIYKTVGNKVFVLVKIQTEGADEDKPFLDIGSNERFLFYLELNNPLFMTVSNVDAEAMSQKKRYYFSNISNNSVGTSLHLSARIAAYGNTLPYKPGDLVDNGAGNIFENIKLTNAGHSTTESGFWVARGNRQFVSGNDMLRFTTTNASFTVITPAKQFSIAVAGFNTVTGLYDKSMTLVRNTFTSNEPTKLVSVDFTGIPPGRYKVNINGEEFDVFIDNIAVYNNVLGVIEIFNHLPATSKFALLDSAGKVKDVVVAGNAQWLRFQVHFANRLAYWKYLAPKKGVKAIKDNTNTHNFLPNPPLPAVPDYFQSDSPIPLKQSPVMYDVELTNPVSTDPPAAPNPNPLITGMLSLKEPEKDYYCNIYLNY